METTTAPIVVNSKKTGALTTLSLVAIGAFIGAAMQRRVDAKVDRKIAERDKENHSN